MLKSIKYGVDSVGNLFFADGAGMGVRKVSIGGITTIAAGDGIVRNRSHIDWIANVN